VELLAQDKNCQKGAITMAGIVKSHLYTMSSKTTNQVIIKSIFWYDMHIFT